MAVKTAVILSATMAAMVLATGVIAYRPASAVSEETVQFQDGAGNEKLAFVPGDTAEFYVRDAGLATTPTSSAIWNGLGFQVQANTWWSLATGDPAPGVYQLQAGSLFSTSSPSQTLLSGAPTTTVNAVPTLVSNLNAILGEFALLTDVNTSSVLAVEFAFDITDSYALASNRVRVTSTSDAVGEWLAITEVVSETDSAASPTSGLFRGTVELGVASSTQVAGDGKVWVQEGDIVSVAYYGSGEAQLMGMHTAQILEAPPVPAVGWYATVALTVAFAAAFLLTVRSTGSRRWA